MTEKRIEARLFTAADLTMPPPSREVFYLEDGADERRRFIDGRYKNLNQATLDRSEHHAASF